MKDSFKFFRLFGLTVCALFTFTSVLACSDDNDEDVQLTIPSQILSDGITFAKGGGTYTLSIQSSSDLTVTSANTAWCTVAETSTNSKITRNFIVTATANSDTSDRSTTLAVASGSESATINVTQTAADGLLLETSTITLTSAQAQSFQVVLSTNGEPTITINDSWITQTTTKSAMADKTYTFTASANYLEERTGTITFTLGDLTETLMVTQPSGVASSDMPSDAKTLAAKIYAGINIGNTLEAIGGETAWGNPKITSTYIAGLKSLGFNAVRIPCAWDSHLSDESTYEIDATWLDRVSEVVGYCVENDMYAILNIHWDGGWLEDNITSGYSETINAEQEALWTQIATKMNAYDEHLLFAGSNEVGMNETSSSGTVADKDIETIMKYEQTFVDAVRATGGNNATRCLIVQAPATRISDAVSGAYGMPDDTATDRLMVEIHYYDPYQFCLMEEDASWGNVFWYWGSVNYVDGSTHNATWGEEDYVVSQFESMKTAFVDKGYPVVLGEYCATKRTVSENQQKHNDSRAYWNEVVTREAKNHGLVPFYWETGGDIDRSTGTASEDYAITGILAGAAAGIYPF